MKRLHLERCGLTLVLALCVATICVMAGACSKSPKTPETPSTPDTPKATEPTSLVFPSSYQELFDSISTAIEENQNGSGAAYTMGVTKEASGTQAGDTAVETAYSTTNTQVAGIDEGDIVKTDGNYIYSISNSDVVIVEPAGNKTRELARITIASDSTTNSKEAGSSSVYRYPSELYIQGDMLAIVSTTNNIVYEYDKTGEPYQNIARTEIDLYDVSNPLKPTYVKTLGQDGYFTSSRMTEGILYLVSNYYLYDYKNLSADTPKSFVPSVYEDGTAKLVEPSNICIMPEFNTISFTVISSVDLEKGSRISTQCMLGDCYAIYMSPDNLYIGETIYNLKESEPYTESVYTIVDYVQSVDTRITRFALSDGFFELGASSIISGRLLNQFSLDEYEGYLRVVTTIESYSYRILTDDAYDVESWQERESISENALYVLDGKLGTYGSIEGLAEDERVYSVRFDGPVGYFVTYRQIDPLFAVDLSEPASPVVLSALKIPGFSQYLHVYQEGRLLGLGMTVNKKTGFTDGLKLSMFDTSDPLNVTEIDAISLDDSWSEALYNHKAVFISQENDIIGFPVESGYVIYGYSDAKGFYLRKTIGSTYGVYNVRGLFIGNYIYVCSNDGVGIYTLTTLDDVAHIVYSVK